MNKETQSIVVGLLGGLLISMTVSGRFTSYVKPGFGPLLLAGGIVLVLIAVVTLAQTIRSEVRTHRAHELAKIGADDMATGTGAAPMGEGLETAAELDAHGHDHATSRAPWLILLPVLVLLLVAPTALGADAVARGSGSQGLAGLDVVAPAAGGVSGDGGYKPNDGLGHVASSGSSSRRTIQFPPLPGGKDPMVTMKDFVLRALYDGENSVAKNTVAVTGFIAPAGQGQPGGYTLARVVISCCAADANPLRVHIDGTAPYPSNTWVTAVISARAGTGTQANDYVPTVDVDSIHQVAQPSDPYEH